MFKKLLSIVLVFTLLLSIGSVSATAIAPATKEVTAISADISFGDRIVSFIYYILDRVLNYALSFLNLYIPKQEWTKKADYEPVNFYEGTESFDSAPKAGAKWSLGYSSASLLDGQDVLDGKHYMGGGLEILEPKVCTAILDDQRVRTFAISDGSDGIVCYAILDAYALCSGDVLAIREMLKTFAEEKGIVSINIGVLHQHSCVDTLGMNGELIRALVQNTTTLSGIMDLGLHSGRNPEFMENLRNVVANTIKDAVEDMREGDLYYGTANAEDLIRDKRDPQLFDPNLNRLRFVPSDSTAETWIVSAGIHCVGLGASTTELSSDYPYYVEQELKSQKGVNFVFIQGAQLAITTDGSYTSIDGNSRLENVKLYAAEITRRLIGIYHEEKVEPLLNIRHKQVFLPVENQILTLCANIGIFDTTVIDLEDGSYEMVSEIGYMELGNSLAVFLAPGELAPEIAYGGAISAEDSWNGESWDYTSIQDYINDSGRKLLVYGIMNDEVGYILTDNDYRSLFSENEEINASSGKAGSTIMEGFMSLYDELSVIS
ncbi:MAG TPA: hypothetical protein VFC76_02035 [Oscillospiraceae bacterium]|nr:hypothetical protein [Oscillospiraceae bacterium]